jgi:regulator of replication initiation timing
MSGTVNRTKYDTIKRKAEQWRNKALEAFDEIQELREALARVHNGEGNDSEELDKLTRERDSLVTEVSTLRRRMGDEVFKQERELVRKNGEIDRLKMSLSDYKERYQETSTFYLG